MKLNLCFCSRYHVDVGSKEFFAGVEPAVPVIEPEPAPATVSYALRTLIITSIVLLNAPTANVSVSRSRQTSWSRRRGLRQHLGVCNNSRRRTDPPHHLQSLRIMLVNQLASFSLPVSHPCLHPLYLLQLVQARRTCSRRSHSFNSSSSIRRLSLLPPRPR